MAAPVIADRFAEQCSVVFANHNDTCGGLDRDNLAFLTPSQLESLFAPGGLWAEMDAWFMTAFEMKACGTKTYAMYDWIMSNTRGRGNMINSSKMPGSKSLLHPFIYARQSSVINDDYWNVDNGWVQSDYTATTTGPLSVADLAEGEATDRVIRVSSGNGIDLDNKWFNPGMRLFIITRTGGTVGIGQWEILARATATNMTYTDVLMKSMNGGAYVTANFEAAPTTGLLVHSTNNINDFEKWCYNEPNYDGDKMVPIWIKTFRRTRCVDSEYRKAYTRLMASGTNEAFKRFGDMELAKRNAQDELKHKKRWVNNFFFSVPSDANQTLALWQSLESVTTPSGFGVDPGTGGRLIAKRAENIGVLEQLRRCNRVRDLDGEPLNMYEFWEEIYRLQRSRETNRGTVTEIDFYTDSLMAANFHRGMLAYWKKESLEMLSLNQDFTKTNAMGMKYRSYQAVFPTGVQVNIIVDKFFDDFRSANKAKGQEEAGTILTALDLGSDGTIYWAQIASNRKSFTTGEIEKLAPIDRDWACVMESVTEERTLVSDTGGVVVECPQDQIWIWNIANETPVVTGVTPLSPDPGYHDLY